MTHYEVLGVPVDASTVTVRRAYLALARRHHPDFHGDDDERTRAESERVMRRLNEAWTVLADPVRRAVYDREIGVAPDPDVFRPFHSGDQPDDDLDGRDWADLADEAYHPDDAPLTGARLAILAPVGLFAVSVGLFSVGLVLGSTAVLGVAILAFVASCVGFLVVPLVHLARARDD